MDWQREPKLEGRLLQSRFPGFSSSFAIQLSPEGSPNMKLCRRCRQQKLKRNPFSWTKELEKRGLCELGCGVSFFLFSLFQPVPRMNQSQSCTMVAEVVALPPKIPKEKPPFLPDEPEEGALMA